jgi:hypothetical protein
MSAVYRVSLAQALFFCTVLLVGIASVSAQGTDTEAARPGVFVAVGFGSASSQVDAVEAARLDAANNVVFKEMRRDSVYRDLFVPEAFKNGWFDGAELKKNGTLKWTATVTIKVDESVAEALYLGRYSTTVGALLDSAEEALAEIRSLQDKGGTAEANGDLGAAETAYRRAEAKAVETMRYLGPVEDATFFSSTGNRKAPELKSLIVAAKGSAEDGVGRIRSAQERLAMDAKARNVLALLETVERDLSSADAAADELHPLAAAPRSYETQLLRDAEGRGRNVRESLGRRRKIVEDQTSGLGEEMTYPRTRADLLLDQIDSLDRSLKTSISAIAGELRSRSQVAKIAAWTIDHEPKDYLSLGLLFPFGVSPRSGGTAVVGLPATFDARGEGAFPFGRGGFWARSRLRAGEEDSTNTSDYTISQGIDIGLFNTKLIGIGLRWDWLREDEDGDRSDSITAVAVTFGDVGEGLGEKTYAPRWTLTAAWEIPKEDESQVESDFLPLSSMNIALDTTLRPNPWIRFDADASARTRSRDDGDWWVGNLGFGFGFRLPFAKPLLWKLRWEGSSTSPIVDNEILDAPSKKTMAFRFGLEYTF